MRDRERSLVDAARALFLQSYGGDDAHAGDDDDDVVRTTTVAPGRVNLIGEHVDYTCGYVLPMAIGFATVCHGTGRLVATGAGRCRVASTHGDGVVAFDADTTTTPLDDPQRVWANYVVGVVREYRPLCPPGTTFALDLAVAGDVPLGAGLSSSASLEVSVATFLEECLLQSSSVGGTALADLNPKERALRCQAAERGVFVGCPCGIMDQYVSSAAVAGHALLIDCETNDFELVRVSSSSDDAAAATDDPVFVVCNSNVRHDNAGGEYPVRVRQCVEALAAIQAAHDGDDDDAPVSLRHVTEDMLERAALAPLLLRRARHVVSENARTLACRDALEHRDYARAGRCMNASHASLRDDYEVSCPEIDVLVALAQSVPGVYGSRITGGGFGGCTVTLVAHDDAAERLAAHLQTEYRARTGRECVCFHSSAAGGARVLRC